MVNLFEFTDYKLYLKQLIRSSDVRGFGSRLAEAAGCQRSYFSSVLAGKPHLLPDHIFGIIDFLKLTDAEAEFLFLILDYQRASSAAYKKSLLSKIQKLKANWLDLKNRVSQPITRSANDDEVFQRYYSNFLYSALHIAVSIPKLQDVSALASYFALPTSVILSYLEDLEKMNFVERVRTKWVFKAGDSHLPKDSPWIQTHHTNWRLQCLNDLMLRKPESLHYSVVQALSSKDLQELRFRMVEWVQEFKKKSGPSSSEELICFNLDVFTLERK